MRNRGWRRKKNFSKAKRKRIIDLYATHWSEVPFDVLNFNVSGGMYKNLNQYSKNKIHCSCPWCSPRTRNKGRHRNKKNYSPSINYKISDLRKKDRMENDELEYFNI